jgi:hypothetical protein
VTPEPGAPEPGAPWGVFFRDPKYVSRPLTIFFFVFIAVVTFITILFVW